MIDLINKPVANRRRKPTWATSEQKLNQHFLKSRAMRRWMIAKMYWIENKAAREIAEHFSMSLHAVEVILNRLNSR